MNNVRIIDIRVFINGVEYKDIYMGKNDTIRGMEMASNTKGIDFGVAMSRNIEVGIHDPSHSLNSKVRNSKLKIVYTVLNDSTQSTTFNEYIIYDSYRKGNSFTVIAQDKMFQAEENLGKMTKRKTGKIKEFLNDICSHLKITSHNLPDNIGDISITIEPSKYSARGFIGEVAAINGGFSRLSRNDRLEFLNIRKQYDNVIDKDFSNMIKTDAVDEPITINGLVYAQEIKHGEAPALVIPFNNLLESMNNKEEIVKNIYNQIKGITYTPVSGELYYIPFLQAGDFFKANSYNGNYITVASDIEYELGGLITFRNSGLAITDNLAINARAPVPIEDIDPGEPEPPEPEPELPDFEIEIVSYLQPQKDITFVDNVIQSGDNIWVRLDVIDHLKFVPDNYNSTTYKPPGTKGYETEEGEYGEGTYSLVERMGAFTFYERYITPKFSLDITDAISELPKSKIVEYISNFDDYFMIEDDAVWVRGYVPKFSSKKLIVPSSFNYIIKLKNNEYDEDGFDEEYYKGLGKLCLVDCNNLTWYGLDDIIKTYITDRFRENNRSILYENDGETFRSKNIDEVGVYDDFNDGLVDNTIGGVYLNGDKMEIYSREIEGLLGQYADLIPVKDFSPVLKKRSYLYEEYDKGNYLKTLYYYTGRHIILDDTWYNSFFYPVPEHNNISRYHYRVEDWEWDFYRKGFMFDSYKGYTGRQYYCEIWTLMKPKQSLGREYVESMFSTQDGKDYETTYTKDVLIEIILDDIENKGELTKEFFFKPFANKNRIFFKRRLTFGSYGEFSKYSPFGVYKDYGKEKICDMFIYQEDLERDRENETQDEFIQRVADEYGVVYEMEVKDRDNKNHRIPVVQALTGYSGWPDDYFDLPFNVYADTPIIYPMSARLMTSPIVMQPKIKEPISYNIYPPNKINNMYYWILNISGEKGKLKLNVFNNINNNVYIYTVRNNTITNKYVNESVNEKEILFNIKDDKYDKIIIISRYAFDLINGVIYDKSGIKDIYIDNNTVDIKNMKGVNRLWKEF